MKRALLALPLLLLVACKKDPAPAPPAPAGAEAPAPVSASGEAEDDASDPQGVGESGPGAPAPHGVDRLGARTAPHVEVTEPLVTRYLAYRRGVVERGRAAVAEYKRSAPAEDRSKPTSAAVKTARAAEAFAVRMRAIEESARAEAKLSRDEVAAVGQVASEVFAARQIWRLSGGDAALEEARAAAASAKAAAGDAEEAALAQRARGFAAMKQARSARERFGDAAVDAVLAHEDALWKVQQDGARVMAEVY